MSNDKYAATFGPLPQRTPMEAMAAHGEPPPDPRADLMHYASPGRPPWVKPRFPSWAWVSTILGVVGLCVSGGVLSAMLTETGPVPAVSDAPAAVVTTGTCEKRLVGEYGLVATVRATNSTEKDQTGVLWVRWPVTGEAAQEFAKRVTLAPGASTELPVNQAVPAERWYRTGACSFGWSD